MSFCPKPPRPKPCCAAHFAVAPIRTGPGGCRERTIWPRTAALPDPSLPAPPGGLSRGDSADGAALGDILRRSGMGGTTSGMGDPNPSDLAGCGDSSRPSFFRRFRSSCCTIFFSRSRLSLRLGSKSRSPSKISTCRRYGARSAELRTTLSPGEIRTMREWHLLWLEDPLVF